MWVPPKRSGGDGVGLFLGHGAAQLGTQALGVLIVAVFAFSASFIIWFAMKKAIPGGVRVDVAHEHEGLDRAECGADAYGEAPALA